MTGLAQLQYAVSVVTVVAVCAVLSAVVLSFILLHRGDTRTVRRSPVATLTMLGFLGGFYLLIHFRLGEVGGLGMPLRIVLAVVGCLLLLLGAAVNLAGRISLRRNWADQATVYSDQQLVTHGVYAVVRHPLYASLIWMYVGAALAYANVAALAANLLIFVPAMYWRARLEEQLLITHLTGYTEYQQQTPMLMPKMRRWHK